MAFLDLWVGCGFEKPNFLHKPWAWWNWFERGLVWPESLLARGGVPSTDFFSGGVGDDGEEEEDGAFVEDEEVAIDV